MLKIKNIILKFKCRKLYKQLPIAVKMQLYLEQMLPDNSCNSYVDILNRALELKESF